MTFHQIEQMAKAICGEDRDPRLFAQAELIAENELILQYVGAERVSLIERLQDPFAVTPAKRSTDMELAKIRGQQAEVAYGELSQLVAKLKSRGDEVFTFFEPRKCEPGEPVYRYIPLDDRDEYDAMHEAEPDLERLRRYERRAWSRRKKAVRVFIGIKLARCHGEFKPAASDNRDTSTVNAG